MQGKTTKEEEFEFIYRAYQHEVYKASLYITKDEYMAQDIMQKAFYKLYLHFDNINLECVRLYLIRTAKNLSYNWVRDMKREFQGEYLDNISEDSIILHGPEDDYLIKEGKKRKVDLMGVIMEELYEENESWYDILQLIYCMGKSHEQAADELGITVQVLYSKLYRAKRWIRKKFENEYNDIE